MVKVVVIVDCLKKGKIEVTFGGTYETEDIEEKIFSTMKQLKEYFEEVEEEYEEKIGVVENIIKLLKKEKIIDFRTQDYMESLGNIYSKLPAYFDIYIDPADIEKKSL